MSHQRLVVKIGTASISRPEGGLNVSRIRLLAEELSAVQKRGWSVILVTSGAIGAGMDQFGWKDRPKLLRDKQAAAAVGQVALMEAYRSAFSAYGMTVAQMLVTRADLEDRARYVNARNTLSGLLALGVIPILNENDTVATEEIRFGDNDSLAALVAAKTDAKKLFLLTDVDGLLTSPGAEGRLLPEVFRITPDIEALAQAGAGSKKSVGGMASKIQAARLAMAAGAEVWIASGKKPGAVLAILEGQGVGTRFHPQAAALNARQRWIAFGRRPRGAVVLDEGAVRAILHDKRSLLPSGILRVEGAFHAGDTVRILDSSGRDVARGLTAFSAEELAAIRGKKTSEAQKLLRRAAPAEVVHRNNLVFL